MAVGARGACGVVGAMQYRKVPIGRALVVLQCNPLHLRTREGAFRNKAHPRAHKNLRAARHYDTTQHGDVGGDSKRSRISCMTRVPRMGNVPCPRNQYRRIRQMRFFARIISGQEA